MQKPRQQVITGVVPPLLGEAIIREVWPSVAAHTAAASMGRALTRTLILAPLAWLLLAPVYFMKIIPVFSLAMRYTLTNRRLMIQRGLKAHPTHEVALAKIDEVIIDRDANSEFFRAGNLRILSQGKVILTLLGVPEPESFRHNIIQAVKAWVPRRANATIVPAKAPI